MAFNAKILRMKWVTSSAAVKLVVVNVVVFIIIRSGDLVCGLSGLNSESWVHFWMIPSSLVRLSECPWTPIVYMFAQFDVLHCLFNMMWLYGFSRLFLSFSTPRQLIALYFLSGISGAVFYLAGMNLLPALACTSGWLIGSSAAVMGIVMAVGFIAPDMPLGLMFIGEIKLKWIAVASLVLFVICGDPGNIGGQLAHFGGALMGMWYGLMSRRGKDVTGFFNRCIDKIVNLFHRTASGNKSNKRPKVKPFRNERKKKASKVEHQAPATDSFTEDDQADLDIILDKIKKSGYTALSAEEKSRLFDVSKRIR